MKTIHKAITLFTLLGTLAGCGSTPAPEQVTVPEQAATTSPETPAVPATPAQVQAVTLIGNHSPVFRNFSAPFTGHNAAGRGAVEVKQIIDIGGRSATFRTDVLLTDDSGSFNYRVNYASHQSLIASGITLAVKSQGAPDSTATNYLFSLDSAGNSAGN